jgi:hypothetical protein
VLAIARSEIIQIFRNRLDRAERFQSAQAFRAALRSATEARPTTRSLTRPDLHHHASTALA